MNSRTPSLLVCINELDGSNRQKYAANTIRRINMELWSNGFAANKGFSDEILCHPDGFVWTFENTVQRDLALVEMEVASDSCAMPIMKIQGRLSSSHIVHFPRLSPSLREKWERLKSKSSAPTPIRKSLRKRK
ncbi:hypothetical protein ACVNAN_002733 [Enterobacter hormaechei]|nr:MULTISPECIES: hypothetical protein [Enterobacter cloacae complex]EHN8926899.1 hypothetical protein [Enterobacter hormaechei]EJV1265779.1 hypothetical protein [Enterobacter hormaechei]EKJ6981377.1 hypothetical protein [Enterobacter hormaechei]EKU3242332.1 hypothetical protein [Enterobacter hormaechei]EKV8338492.1 hypothetical protein [Enterobacter hormaechei]